MVDRANDVIDRLEALDKTVINASAFRILLEDLHARDLTQVAEPHVASITMVRAGILRAALGSVMSCLDRADPRGNRASIGQILERLNDSALVTFFLKPGQSSGPTFAALERAKRDYRVVIGGQLFEAGKQLRDRQIAHTLIKCEPIPEVTYQTIGGLHGAAVRLATVLFRVCNQPPPEFIDQAENLSRHAKVFWDTYFGGMSLTA